MSAWPPGGHWTLNTRVAKRSSRQPRQQPTGSLGSSRRARSQPHRQASRKRQPAVQPPTPAHVVGRALWLPARAVAVHCHCCGCGKELGLKAWQLPAAAALTGCVIRLSSGWVQRSPRASLGLLCVGPLLCSVWAFASSSIIHSCRM